MKKIYTILMMLIAGSVAYGQISVSTNGTKYVLMEQVTSAKVQFAPDGVVFMNNIISNRPNTIGIMHHPGGGYADGMTNVSSTAFLSAFGYSVVPSATIDRKKFPSEGAIFTQRGAWDAHVAAQQQTGPNFDITLTYSYNETTRQLQARVYCKALANLTGQYQTNLFIIEDSVTGSGSNFDQVNFYNSQGGHPFFGMGNPIVGYNHMNVVREVLSGVYGQSLFVSPTINDTAGNNYTYTLPPGYNSSRVRLVATISKYNSGNINDNEVQNAVASKSGLACAYATPVAQICAATTDNAAGKNVIAWQAPAGNKTAFYKIYRENGGSYTLLTTQAATSPTVYTDAGSNPQMQAYKYKIVVVDECLKETVLDQSTAHKTIHLKFDYGNSSVNKISWTAYEGNVVTGYTILRSTNAGMYSPVGTVAGTVTTYSDNNPPAGDNSYRVQATLSSACTPSGAGSYSSVESNTTSAWKTGVGAASIENTITISPNPAKEQLTVKWNEKIKGISVYNVSGQRVFSGLNNKNTATVDVSQLAPGVYILQLDNSHFSRFVKQ